MKAYRFRLATLARVRAAGERSARQGLGRAIGDLGAARGAATSALGDYRAGASVPELSGRQLESWYEASTRAAASVVACEARVAEAGVACDAARQRWQVAARQVELLERIDRRRRLEWRAAAERAERAELEDRPTRRGHP
ncbi:MAG: hypothetical protein M0T80_03075 [Actinomycetota bacterium]|nr:hypothetical protein [Actinomycetota bacterium]